MFKIVILLLGIFSLSTVIAIPVEKNFIEEFVEDNLEGLTELFDNEDFLHDIGKLILGQLEETSLSEIFDSQESEENKVQNFFNKFEDNSDEAINDIQGDKFFQEDFPLDLKHLESLIMNENFEKEIGTIIETLKPSLREEIVSLKNELKENGMKKFMMTSSLKALNAYKDIPDDKKEEIRNLILKHAVQESVTSLSSIFLN